jgi:hypothetical protein
VLSTVVFSLLISRSMVCSGETAFLPCYFNVTHNECNEDFFSFQTCFLSSFPVTLPATVTLLAIVACFVLQNLFYSPAFSISVVSFSLAPSFLAFLFLFLLVQVSFFSFSSQQHNHPSPPSSLWASLHQTAIKRHSGLSITAPSTEISAANCSQWSTLEHAKHYALRWFLSSKRVHRESILTKPLN